MARRKRGIDEYYIHKAAHEIVNNSTTLQNDDHFVFAVTANSRWVVELHLNMISSAVADFKFDFSVPSGGYHGLTLDTSGTTFWNQAAASTITACAGSQTLAVLRGTIVIGSTAGNVQFRWAQNTAEATNTTVYADSILVAWRVK